MNPRPFASLKGQIFEELSQALDLVQEETIAAFVRELRPDRRVFCDASGRSRLQVSGFVMRLAQMGYRVQLVGEAASTAIGPGDVLLVCSASGSTPSIVRHAKTAKDLGGSVLVLTATEDSELSLLGDATLFLNAASKVGNASRSIQPMGSLFEQSAGLLLDMLVLRLMHEYAITPEEMSRNHSNLE